MLVLTRKENESICIGDDIVITIVDMRKDGNKVRLGIEAPPQIAVDRKEIRDLKRNAIIHRTHNNGDEPLAH